MTCTAAAILAALHATALPPRGTVIMVPSWMAAQYSSVEQRTYRNCAARFGIVLKVRK